MKHTITACLPVFITTLFLTCCLDGTAQISKAKWLTGTWEHITSKGSLYETWQQGSATGLSGKSYMLKDNDTIVFESISLVEMNDSLFYIPVVQDQNSGQPIRFALTSISENEMIFENKEHDFPQVISYTRLSTDSLLARVSGTKNGTLHKQEFPMRKIK